MNTQKMVLDLQPNGLKYYVEGWGVIDTDTIDTIQVSTYCIERF